MAGQIHAIHIHGFISWSAGNGYLLHNPAPGLQ